MNRIRKEAETVFAWAGLEKNLQEEVFSSLSALESDRPLFSSLVLFSQKYLAGVLPLDGALESVSALAEKSGWNEWVFHLLFLLSCLPETHRRYREKDLSDDLFYNTFSDLVYKIRESKEVKGVAGVFCANWYKGFFDLTRFSYGRFQYEIAFHKDPDFTLSCGVVLKQGAPYVKFHIPSSRVPLTDPVRLDSYRKAYPHFSSLFPGGTVIFGCTSWLLYPAHRVFLPEDLNIRRFMDDFETVRVVEKEEFSNAWRVFGKDYLLPPERLPRKTRLQKAYADWLLQGGKTGSAFGVFAFDGEKILK